MSPSLAARCQQLHAAAEAGDTAAAQRLDRLAAAGPRAAQCLGDLLLEWHRHPGQPDPCESEQCAEASDPAAWARSWEAYWPPGQHPGN